MAAARWRTVRTELQSVRSRVLATVILCMALTLVLVGGITHYLRLVDLEERVEREILQEVSELQRLADRRPIDPEASLPDSRVPAEGEPFTDVDHLLYTFMTSTVPGEYENFMVILDGQPAYEYLDESRFRLDQPERVAVVQERARPGQTVIFDHELEGRSLRIGVIDVSVPGDDRTAYLVIGTDLSSQRQLITDSWWRYLGISAVMLVLGTLVAYFLAGRVTAPITRLREAAERITVDDLTQRVPVSRTDSDVGQLAHHFNYMLDRIKDGFDQQRQFLDDAAHELRTPLTILHGNLELMDAEDPGDVQETRAMLLDEIERMNRLVEDLLLLAKSQRADFVRPETIETGDFLRDAMDRLPALGDRTWRLESVVSGPMVADGQRLTQAVIQLAANAVKFSSPGDTVALGARWSTVHDDPPVPSGGGPRRFLELWVRDTGVGIAPEDQKRIFERFARAEAGRTVEGAGLGLAIVSAIAEAHDGTVRLRSQPGDGSTFTLWIPQRSAAAPVRLTAQPRQGAGEARAEAPVVTEPLRTVPSGVPGGKEPDGQYPDR
ncbi:sensor histidine kinase [Kocuria coralli]|nr:ATP-binding protein [Kocuria coralli]